MDSHENKKWNSLIRHAEHTLHLGDVKIDVLDGVFTPDPHLTYSSSIILNNFPIVAGKAVLDVGTGTGLLAIKSAKNGAKRVVATDISTEAIENTKINREKNKVPIVEIRKTSLADEIRGKFDIIFANLPIEGGLWKVDQKDLLEKFFQSIFNNWKEGTKIYIPWGSFKENDRDFLGSIFRKNGWSYKVIEEFALGYIWYLYVLSRA